MVVGDAMTVMTSVGGGHGSLIIAHGSDTLDISGLDPDVWRRIENACRNLYREHVADIAPPPHRDMTS